MHNPRRGDFIRGTSVLAALVFVAVLSAVAFAVHSIVPSDSMAQTASARLALSESDVSEKSSFTEATPDLKAVLLGDKRCNDPIKVQQDENTQASFDASKDVVNTCVRGCVYKVGESGGSVQAKATDACGGLTGDALKKCITDTACLVLECVGENECTPIPGGSNDGAGSKYLSQRFGVSPTVAIKASPDLQAALASGSQADVNKLPPYLQEVFKTQQAEVIQQNNAKIENYIDAIKDIGASSPTEVKKFESEIERLREQNQRLASITIAKPEDAGTLTPGLLMNEEPPIMKPTPPPILGQSSTFLSPEELKEANAGPATVGVKEAEARALAEKIQKEKDICDSHWGCEIIDGKKCHAGLVRFLELGRNCQAITLTNDEKNAAFNKALNEYVPEQEPSEKGDGKLGKVPRAMWDASANVSPLGDGDNASTRPGSGVSPLGDGDGASARPGSDEGGSKTTGAAAQVAVAENCLSRTCVGIPENAAEEKWLQDKGYKCGPGTENEAAVICTKPNTTFITENTQGRCLNGICQALPASENEQKALEADGYQCAPQDGKMLCTKGTANKAPPSTLTDGFGTPCSDAKADRATCPPSTRKAVTLDAFGNPCTSSKADKNTCPKDQQPPARTPQTPPPAPQRPPGGGDVPPPTPKPAPAPAPAPAPRAQNTPNVWEQGLNNFLKGFIQATISSNPFGGGYGQAGYGQGGYGGGQPPIGNSIPQPPGTCGVAQYCQNNMQYQRNTQCVDQPMQACPYGCNGNQCATSPQNQCPPPPPQPSAAACVGTWMQETTPGPSGLTCVTGWTCAKSATTTPPTTPDATSTPPTTSERPTAEISCAPLIADAGMSISISYACTNAASSTGSSFSTGGALSGTASAVAPNASTSTTYAILCESAEGLRATASCTVQVARPTIVFVVNPQQVLAGQQATVGWVTSGMKSCVVSSPDSSSFTSQNAGKTATSGTAQTPPLGSAMRLVLACETSGGNTKTATTTATLKQDGTPPSSIEENNGYCLAVAANSSQRLFLTNRGYQCDAATTNTSCSRLKGAGECI